MDAIITLWESIDYADEQELDYVFLKIDFDKACDRIEYDFIFQSLYDIGMGRQFTTFIHILFGNAFARISINGELTDAIPLKMSVRQGCPIAPMLYAICSDALGWIVQDAMQRGTIKVIKILGAKKDLCLQQFADDTNSLFCNDGQSIQSFFFCAASGSVINHSKTGYKTATGNAPPLIMSAGCKNIEDGQIFRLLGIPMGSKSLLLRDGIGW